MSRFTGVYAVLLEDVSVSAAKTLCQVNAGSDQPFEIVRAWVTFDSTTSTAIEIALKAVSTAGTGTAFTAEPIQEGQAFDGSMSTDHTAEGTLVDHLVREHVNYLQGFRYVPVPEERIRVAGGGRIALELPVAPGAAVSICAGMIVGLL